ncbi:MAG: GAF domain-containing protein, partial [Thermoanaerobaculia bacterium]|nr:GAF domain-containing protein [Thermoanaerobaculia bacterium]
MSDDRNGEIAAPTAAPGEGLDERAGVGDDTELLSYCVSLARDLSTASDLDSGLERIAEGLRGLVPYDTFGVLLTDDLGQELRFAYAVGYPSGVAEHWRFGLGQGVVGHVAASGEAIRIDDTGVDSRYIDADRRSVSELAVPLTVKNRVIGVLDVGAVEPAAFTERHQKMLSLIAGHLAAAIDTARLYRNLKQQTQTLSALHQVGRELTSILDQKQLLENVAKIVQKLIDYDTFTLLLWSQENDVLEPVIAVSGSDQSPVGSDALRLGQGICGTAAALRQAIRSPNTDIDPRYEECANTPEPIRSELAVPLLFKDRLIGVLDLGSHDYNAFSDAHEQALTTLGASLAIGLENSRLYQQLRREEEILADELSTARELQRQLLPKSTPWIRDLKVSVVADTARQLGGDFYDYLGRGPDQVAFAVGDVSGKGTSAALYGALAAGTLREYVDSDALCPAQVLADMNNRLFQLDLGNRVLALAFAVYDRAKRSVTVASSG